MPQFGSFNLNPGTNPAKQEKRIQMTHAAPINFNTPKIFTSSRGPPMYGIRNSLAKRIKAI